MADRKRRKKDKAAEEEEDDEDASIGPSSSIGSHQISEIVSRLRDNPEIKFSKGGLGLDGEEGDKLWEEVKKNPFLIWDSSEDKMYFNKQLLEITPSNFQDKLDMIPTGISREDLLEYNPSLGSVIRERLRDASFLALKGLRDSNKHVLMLYPRGNSDFHVRLSGQVTCTKDSKVIETDKDLRGEIRRGDVIIIDGKTYRVSTEQSKLDTYTKRDLREYIEDLGGDPRDIEDVDLLIEKAHFLTQQIGVVKKKKQVTESYDDQLEKTRAPYSSSSLQDPIESVSKKPIVFKYDFTDKRLPLDISFKSGNGKYDAYKHGCTNDVRRLYMEVASDPHNNYKVGNEKLDSLIVEENLIDPKLLADINKNKIELKERLETLRQNKAALRGRRGRGRGIGRRI